MTFSIAGTDGAGRLGIAVSSSSPAVAARCIHLRDGVGAVSSQNITDPRLGAAMLDRLEAGLEPEAALSDVLEQEASREYRQLVLLDAAGGSAVFHGAHTLGTHAAATGAGCVSAGNMLADASVTDAVCWPRWPQASMPVVRPAPSVPPVWRWSPGTGGETRTCGWTGMTTR